MTANDVHHLTQAPASLRKQADNIEGVITSIRTQLSLMSSELITAAETLKEAKQHAAVGVGPDGLLCDPLTSFRLDDAKASLNKAMKQFCSFLWTRNTIYIAVHFLPFFLSFRLP